MTVIAIKKNIHKNCFLVIKSPRPWCELFVLWTISEYMWSSTESYGNKIKMQTADCLSAFWSLYHLYLYAYCMFVYFPVSTPKRVPCGLHMGPVWVFLPLLHMGNANWHCMGPMWVTCGYPYVAQIHRTWSFDLSYPCFTQIQLVVMRSSYFCIFCKVACSYLPFLTNC